jgi:hypothetical protein
MTRIMHRAGIGVTHGAGDGLSEFPSDLADAGTAGSAAAFSVQTSDASALVTLASSIRGSDAPALYMRALVAVSVTAWAGASTAAAGTARPAHVRHRRLGRGDARQRREGRVAGDWLSLGGPSPIQAHSEPFLPTATPLKTRSKRAKKLARNERISSVLAVVFSL